MPDQKSPKGPRNPEAPAGHTEARVAGSSAPEVTQAPPSATTPPKPAPPAPASPDPTGGGPGEDQDTLEPTVPCVLCKQDIPKGAKICTHCDRRQARWLRHLPTLQSLAALALAAIAVITFAFSTYERLDKRIQVTEGEAWTGEGTVQRAVFFSNPLKQEGYLVRAILIFEDAEGNEYRIRLLATDRDSDAWKLPGEKQKRIEFAFRADEHPKIPRKTPLTATRMEIALVNGASKVQSKTVFEGTRQNVQF